MACQNSTIPFYSYTVNSCYPEHLYLKLHLISKGTGISWTHFPFSLSLMDGWMTCYFKPFSTVFQSYQDDGRMLMKGLCNPTRFTFEKILPQAGA